MVDRIISTILKLLGGSIVVKVVKVSQVVTDTHSSMAKEARYEKGFRIIQALNTGASR